MEEKKIAATDSFRFRLKQLRGDTPQAKFANDLQVPQTTFGRWERGEAVPDLEFAQSLCAKLGVEPRWLLTGRGPVYDPERTTITPARAGMLRAGGRLTEVEVTAPQPTAERIIECDTSELVMVPMVEARLSAGTGSFQTGDTTERFYAFRLDFLRRKGIPSNMALMRVSGDSMEPEIKDGDVVLIDQGQQTPTPGKLFAVGVEDMVYIKEVNAAPGKLVLSSYNKAYPALEVDARGDLKDGIRIIGRAVWVGRELK